MDTLQRAARAKALRDDPLLKEAFEVLENAQIAVFTDPTCADAEVLEARRVFGALRGLRDQLHTVIEDGQLLEHRLAKGKLHRG